MEQGTVNELVLTRSITKHIRKHNKRLAQGTSVGDDYASIPFSSDSLIWTEGVDSNPYIAWCKAMNNFAVSGGDILGVRLLFVLPDDAEEESIKSYMAEFNALADEEKVQIMGGHTRVDEACKKATFSVSVIGSSGSYIQKPKECKSGYQIIMTKYAAILGSDILSNLKKDQLEKRLSKTYIQGGSFGRDMYRIKREADIASSLIGNVCYMHDISFGGVYGALWQLGSKLGKGLKINHYDIPIKQETIEFAEIFDINPYMLEGTGSLLIVAREGEEVVKALGKEGISATIVGEITDTKERYVVLGESEEKRFLAPVKGDEIYKVVSAY